MIKFIIEVSEDFIREKANPEGLFDILEQSKGADSVSEFATFMACNAVESLIDKGMDEFTINQDRLTEAGTELFLRQISGVFALAVASATKISEEEQQEERIKRMAEEREQLDSRLKRLEKFILTDPPIRQGFTVQELHGQDLAGQPTGQCDTCPLEPTDCKKIINPDGTTTCTRCTAAPE